MIQLNIHTINEDYLLLKANKKDSNELCLFIFRSLIKSNYFFR